MRLQWLWRHARLSNPGMLDKDGAASDRVSVCACVCASFYSLTDHSQATGWIREWEKSFDWINVCDGSVAKKKPNQKPPVGLCNNNSLYARNFCPCQNSTRPAINGEKRWGWTESDKASAANSTYKLLLKNLGCIMDAFWIKKRKTWHKFFCRLSGV